jgi:hypothetical protein
MNKEKYVAECPKCKAIYKGSANYFRYDLKEKCFDGITELVNYRIAGDEYDADADAIAKKMIDDALASLRANTQKIIADEIARSKR